MRQLSIQFVAISIIIVLSIAGIAQGTLSWISSQGNIELIKRDDEAIVPYIALIETQDAFDDSRLEMSSAFFNPDKERVKKIFETKQQRMDSFLKKLSVAEQYSKTPETHSRITGIKEGWAKYLEEDALMMRLLKDGKDAEALDHFSGPAKTIRTQITDHILDYRKILFEEMQSINKTQNQKANLSIMTAMIGLAIFIITAILAISYFKFSLLKPLEDFNKFLKYLSTKDTSTPAPHTKRQDELGEMARSMETLRLVTIDAFRSEAAVADGSIPILIADGNNVITSVNRSFITSLIGKKDEIRKVIPSFDPENLIGKSMDIFHKNPDHQRNIINNLTTSYVARVPTGNAIFELTAWPVRGVKGERLGTVLQWADKTNEVHAQRDIDNLVHAASAGDFSQRISLEGKAGFFKDLAKNLNLVSENVDRGLNEANRMLSALSRGDVGIRFDGEFEGQFRQLQTSANSTAETLAGISSRISTACEGVLSATREISVGATDLSERTEQQAASLQETAASMEELATTVRHTASNARDAAGMSQDAETSAERGGMVVSDAVSAMSRIEDSAGKITEIVGLIEEIAFQTNLLALNAAVEAARAGEAGKGFAVVASEVRALAQRAGAASREIKGLIVASNAEVRDGVSLVRQAGEALEGIVTSVRRAARVIAEISSAAGEQSAGLDEVNKAVSQLDQITQQNAALVEETTAALDSTRTQVEELADLIGFFKLANETAHDVVPLRPRGRTASAANPAPSPARRLQETARTQVKARLGARTSALSHEDADDWKEF